MCSTLSVSHVYSVLSHASIKSSFFFCCYPAQPLVVSIRTLTLHDIRVRGLRTSATDDRSKQKNPNLRKRTERKKRKEMDKIIVSSLPTEKLDRSSYASWSDKMHQYFLGHDY